MALPKDFEYDEESLLRDKQLFLEEAALFDEQGYHALAQAQRDEVEYIERLLAINKKKREREESES